MPKRLLPRRPQALLLAGGLLILTALGAAAAFESNRHLKEKQGAIVGLHRQAAEAQRLLLLLAESHAATHQWLLSGRAEDRDAAVRSGDALRHTGRELAGRLAAPLDVRGLPSLGATLEHVLRVRDQAHALNETAGQEAARQVAAEGSGLAATAQMRDVLGEFRQGIEADLTALDAELREGQWIGLLLVGASSAAMLAMLLAAIGQLARRRSAAERASAAMDARGREVAALFRMGELLQSSHAPEDIRRVVSHTAAELLPALSGAFYVFNNSRDRLDMLGLWGARGLPPDLPEHFAPEECWALKRGRPHGPAAGDSLACDHLGGAETALLCVPMQARGEVYGVLSFFHPERRAMSPQQVELAQALADGVSLALANLALREKLRNQALRDELTGLHNRRFLEETLPRVLAHAERRNASLAVMMLDLDHFKQVNDRYGHATGDAVLREVGRLLLARLRRMDLACRYGGEELLILMPDCTAAEALVRAREICAQIRGLREAIGGTLPQVTVSIGVAAWPEHGEQIGRVIEAADAALYAAKRAGRDRALPAEATVEPLPLPG
ncbi:GGDEF domain-containing protein [Roseomonas sp. AR75]|uniref:sensor domain-containing diguanylate cyclase n=1 Tax=Roseomonas sp. AR75 TaxID=2562311 RepID=UPI00148520F6|nr:GGDEF domain-containing protein [Roseomonas sp. AR75]